MAEKIDIQLERPGARGVCIGRHEGKIIFVPHTLPGERVRVELTDERADWAGARLVEVLDPSPDRVDPLCPHYGPQGCGGCHWQHASGPAQLEIKRAVAADQLRRLGGLTKLPVAPCRRGGEVWGYRNHARLRLTPDGPGYVAAGGGGVLPVRVCPVMLPGLAELYGRLLDLKNGEGILTLRAGAATGDRMILLQGMEPPVDDLAQGEVSVLVKKGRGFRCLAGGDFLRERVAGFEFRVSPGSFFQVNTAGAGVLVDVMLSRLPERIPGAVLDLYGGAGLFGLPLTRRADRVILIENHPGAAADARHNARAAGVDRIEVIEKDVLTGMKRISPPVAAVVVDPPRRGCGRAVTAGIAALRPEDVIYVSCDTATLARDLRYFQEAGYHPAFIQPVDLFPQTYHVEMVVHLIRENAEKA